eukprot:scaffold10822_cov51-Attheya_sp.AAC.3
MQSVQSAPNGFFMSCRITPVWFGCGVDQYGLEGGGVGRHAVRHPSFAVVGDLLLANKQGDSQSGRFWDGWIGRSRLRETFLSVPAMEYALYTPRLLSTGCNQDSYIGKINGHS